MLHGRYDCGAYTRLQFLRSVSHSVGAHSSRLCDFVEDGSDDDDDADVAATDSPSNSQADSQVVDTPQTNDDNCEVCLIAPRNPRVALVPCGHQRFCIDCANRVHDQGRGCPIRIICFQVTVENVGDVFLGHSVYRRIYTLELKRIPKPGSTVFLGGLNRAFWA